MANRWRNSGNFIFGGSEITADGDCSHEIKKPLLFGRKVLTNLDSILKSRDITLPTNVCLVKAIVFPVVMYGCESWIIKKGKCWRIDGFWTTVFEKTLESHLDCKEIQPVHSEGNQSWIFIGRTDGEAETPIFWPPDAKSWFIWKDPDAGKDWRWEEKGTTEDEMVGWHHWLNGHEFELTAWVGDGQGGLTCCSMGSQRVGHDWATELNWTEPFRRQMENSLKREFFLMNWQLQSVHKKFRRSFLTNHLHCFSLWVLYSFLLSWLLFWLLSG